MPLGNTAILRVGNSEPARMYAGSTLVWQLEEDGTYDSFRYLSEPRWTGWTSGGADGPHITVAGGAVEIAARGGYPAIETTATFNLTTGPIAVGVEQLPNVGTGSTAMTMEIVEDDNNRWNFGWTNNGSFLERFIDGVTNSEFGAGYTSGTTQWRVRHSAPDVIFETSVDGTVWTTRYSRPASEIDITAVKVRLRAGNWNSEASPGAARYSALYAAEAGGGAATPDPVWAEEFDGPLDLTTPTYEGRWRANDVWQPADEGYVDFGSGGSTWNLNPLETIDGALRTPFTVAGSVLTVTAQTKPAAWAADIAVKGGSSTTHVGGILITNTARATERFGYGYYAIRARWPQAGKGMFPALWFFAANGYNPGKEQTEIDLVEIFGYAAGQPWNIALHEKQQGGGPAVGATTVDGQVAVASLNSDTASWHTYGLDWTASYLRFYKDDVAVAEVTGADATFFNGVTMSIRLNYAMDASWFPSDRKSDGTTPNPLTMEVDWIRVWSTKP